MGIELYIGYIVKIKRVSFRLVFIQEKNIINEFYVCIYIVLKKKKGNFGIIG